MGGWDCVAFPKVYRCPVLDTLVQEESCSYCCSREPFQIQSKHMIKTNTTVVSQVITLLNATQEHHQEEVTEEELDEVHVVT